MLAQQAAFYTYKEKAGGIPYNRADPFNPRAVGMLSAGVQLWKNNWTGYRQAHASGTYEDATGSQTPVWRQSASYAWQTSLVNPDGTFNNFTNFAWTGTPATNWIKQGEVVRYDHYSHGLESKDINGLYSASKTGYDGTQLIASASNARYTELAYFGAEDAPVSLNGINHYGGEIMAAGTQVAGTPEPHTGKYSLRLDGNQTLRYFATAGTDLEVNKRYRLSAWLHGSDVPGHGRLYAGINGTILREVSITAPTTKKAGAWHRLVLDISIPANMTGQPVEFGCRNSTHAGNSTTSVYFDDFRLCPQAASMTSTVYDAHTNLTTHVLDNENLYTRYDYNSAGRLLRVYKESFDRPGSNAPAARLIKEYDYNFADIKRPTWVSTAYRCEPGSTGYEERQVVDVNPLNNPPVASRWERNGPSAACRPPVCQSTTAQPRYLYDTNGDGILECIDSTPNDLGCEPCNMYDNTRGSRRLIEWTHGDGSTSTYSSDCEQGECISQKQSGSNPRKKKLTERSRVTSPTASHPDLKK